MSDNIHRFLFDTSSVRGELVKLSDTSNRLLNGHQYPPVIASLLQQVAAINVLLATTLKFEGKISIQLQSPGHLKMLVVQTTHDLKFRGLARYDESCDFSQFSFKELVKGGQLSITIEPTQGKRYQGIVPVEGEKLSDCIEQYFHQSEQLETRIWLFNNEHQVCGVLLQALPDAFDQNAFEHLSHLTSTLNTEECLNHDTETLLHRLFHNEDMQLLSCETVTFNCGCNKQKMLNSINLLPEQEVDDIINNEGHLSVTCEFCLDHFNFSKLDIKTHKSVTGNNTRH